MVEMANKNAKSPENSILEPVVNKDEFCDLHIKTKTFSQVNQFVSELYATKKSFRRIAREDFNGQVSHAVIQRITEGIEPKKPSIRQVLGLPIAKEIIPFAGEIPNGTQVHQAIRCACGQYYIPNHPRRKSCFTCSPFRGKK